MDSRADNQLYYENKKFLDVNKEKENAIDKLYNYKASSPKDSTNITSKQISTNLESPFENENDRKERKAKNSEILYIKQGYEDKANSIKFRDRPQKFTLEEQKSECFMCKKKIRRGFYIIMNNARYCEYSGNWHCTECMATEKLPIPWKALLNFDLRSYAVSKESADEIKLQYELPIIQIQNNDKLVLKTPKLYQFLILKRQLHLMYDQICDTFLM